MLQILRSMFGNNLKEALRRESSIVDVRTVHEYDQGRIRGSINIPIERVPSSLDRIRHMKPPVIFCSNGDSRSANAARYVKQQGIKDVYNGGNWERLLRMKENL